VVEFLHPPEPSLSTLVQQRIVLNPNAGSADEIAAFEDRIARLPGTELVRTGSPGDATRLAREACERGLPRVVAAGGDGTLHEVLQGMAGHFERVQLGLLPVGTGNDFARAVGIPADLDRALALLDLGRELPIDVLRLEAEGTHWVLNASAGGFSAVVSDRLDSDTKDWWGTLAYSVTAVRALPELTTYRLRIRLDDGPVEEIAAWNVVVANAGWIAGGLPVLPGAVVDDGRLDLLVVPEMPIAAFTLLLPQILLGKHADSPELVVRSGTRLRIESDPAMPLNADGEVVAGTPATYEVAHRALRFVVGELGAR
jgi:diacylglycerol kinase (ATP)